MSLAKVIDVLTETIREVQDVYVEGFQALVQNGAVTRYRGDALVTFVVADDRS